MSLLRSEMVIIQNFQAFLKLILEFDTHTFHEHINKRTLLNAFRILSVQRKKKKEKSREKHTHNVWTNERENDRKKDDRLV